MGQIENLMDNEEVWIDARSMVQSSFHLRECVLTEDKGNDIISEIGENKGKAATKRRNMERMVKFVVAGMIMDQKIKRKQLWRSNLEVSCFCLGTAEFGASVSKEEAFRQMNHYWEMGGNFIDTAHIYNDWVPGEKARSEKLIGAWMREEKNREQMIISTKGGHPLLETMHQSRAVPDEIRKDLDESLKFLETEWIDLYFLHRDNKSLPVSELLGVLEEAHRAGKIRYYGCSNWSVQRIKEAVQVARENGFHGFLCNQAMWSLATVNEEKLSDRTLVVMDRETQQFQKENEINSMAYTSLAKGYFSKKLSRLEIAEPNRSIYENEINEDLAKYIKVLSEDGVSPLAVSMGYLMEQAIPTIPIISFRNTEQLCEAIKASFVTLGKERMRQLEMLRDGIKK